MAIDRYFLNNKDMFLQYGFIPGPGCMDTIMQENERKEPYSNDWPEHNGREFDLLAPVRFKERQFKLIGTIKANSYTDYLLKKEALKTELYKGICDVSVVVGGRNLLPNSRSILMYPNDVGFGYASELKTNEQIPYRTITGTVKVSMYMDFMSDYGIVVDNGQYYTTSIEVRTSEGGLIGLSIQPKTEWVNVPQNIWTKISVTSKPQDSYNRLMGIVSDLLVVDYRNYKFEKGTVATDWIPDLKCNAITKSISVSKKVNLVSKPFIMPIEIELTEVFL